jgi:Calcineurin-like phosphoesterase
VSDPRTPLSFRGDSTFTIVQLTDVHWHDGGPEDLRSRELIERVLDTEKPDLVALTGDIVGGDESRDPAGAYRGVVAPSEERSIPWTAVFGNHDDEGSLGRAELLDVQRAHPMCLSERGPEDITGVGNYVLRVGSATGGRLAAALYFLDSGAYAPEGLGTYAWIARDQIAWYVATSRRLAAEYSRAPGRTSPLPALAFFHIPLPEYEEVWQTGTCRGHRHEPVNCPALNSGFFAALVESKDVLGTFVGHDHVNDFEGELHGIRLCYGRASGYGAYGRDGFPRGARVIRLREGERSFDTWVRLD